MGCPEVVGGDIAVDDFSGIFARLHPRVVVREHDIDAAMAVGDRAGKTLHRPTIRHVENFPPYVRSLTG